MAIKNLKRKLERLERKREYIVSMKAEINLKVEEKITKVLAIISSFNGSGEFVDEQTQIA